MRKLLLILSIFLCAVTLQATPIELSLDGSTHDSTKIEESDLDGARGIELSLKENADGLLIDRWEFEEITGTTVAASFGSNTGTASVDISNLRQDVGVIGRAFNFNGSSEYVSFGNSTDWDVTTSVSAFAWIRVEVWVANGPIIGKYETDKREWLFALGTPTAAKLLVQFGDPSDGSFEGRYQTDSSHLTANKWYFVGFTYNAGTIQIYVDGSPVAGSVVLGSIPSTLNNGTADLKVGNAQTAFFDGDIDNPCVFAGVVPTSIITAMWNEGKGRLETGYSSDSPVATFDSIDSGSNDTTWDMSTFLFDVTGSATWDYGASNTDSAVYTGSYQTEAQVLDDTDTTGTILLS
jgi:hypothetical protein